ncbi:MAG: hypothetical protein R3E96_06235 [Planctomycetota bacterium]
MRPSVDPPTISFASTLNTVAPAAWSTSWSPCRTRASSRFRCTTVSSDSTLTDYAFAPSGTVIVPPGIPRRPCALVPAFATPGQTLTLALYHERNGVRFTIPALDPAETTNPDLYAQDVHLDENPLDLSDGGVHGSSMMICATRRPMAWRCPVCRPITHCWGLFTGLRGKRTRCWWT